MEGRLYAPETTAITVQLTEDGEPGTTTVTGNGPPKLRLVDQPGLIMVVQVPASKNYLARVDSLLRP